MVSVSDSQSDGPVFEVLLWPLAGFVLGRAKFKSPATLVNGQLFASYQLGYLNCYVASDLFVSKHLSGVPVS